MTETIVYIALAMVLASIVAFLIAGAVARRSDASEIAHLKAKAAPFDRDGRDGPGGSLKGEQSSAHVGAVRRREKKGDAAMNAPIKRPPR